MLLFTELYFHHQSHPQLGFVFTLALVSSFFLELFLHSSPVVFGSGEFTFQCHIFLPFHTVHGVLKSRILKWFVIPFSSGPHFGRPLHHDLDLIDRVPDELWMESCDIVQETGIKTISMEKKCKKAKWLFAEALQIAVKRREAKSKGENERYTHLNAEFQRIARRDKKTFFSDQCKEIEENNRMGKARDLFKKIRDTKGTFHTKIGSIKDRKGIDLT